jgi:hypothetical protein
MVVVAVAAVLGVSALATDEFSVSKRQAAAAAAAQQNDDEIYTGSILYMPDEGRTCRQLLFDNQTGQFNDNGYVDCERAAYRSASSTPKNWSVARMRVISDGFRWR